MALQKHILHILSWVLKLDGFVLEQIISPGPENRLSYDGSLNNLILGCLVEAKDSTFSISRAVRAVFRRKFGYGSNELLNRLATTLLRQMDEANLVGAVRADLVDAVIYMYALTGKAMPKQFKKLLLPSTLEALVRDAYNSGRENEDSYDLAIRWGIVAEDIQMDESVREEILSSVVRAYTRQEEYGKVNELLEKFDKRDYRSRFFLRGFRLGKEGRWQEAIPHLNQATKERRYYDSAVNQLGIAYFRTGNIAKVEVLLKNNAKSVQKSAFLLDLRAQLYTAENDFSAAERDIQTLARLPEDQGRSRKRQAIILAKRDRDYGAAVRILTDVIDSEKGRAIPLRFLRGLLAAKGGDRATATADADYVRANARKSGDDQSLRILARLHVAERNSKDALAMIGKFRIEHVPDRFLRAYALRLKSEDPRVGLVERERARAEAQEIVGRATTYS